jgi:hypothetical protein
MPGFEVQTLDANENVIGINSEISISGITEVARFESYDFNYVDTAAAAQLATH